MKDEDPAAAKRRRMEEGQSVMDKAKGNRVEIVAVKTITMKNIFHLNIFEIGCLFVRQNYSLKFSFNSNLLNNQTNSF